MPSPSRAPWADRAIVIETEEDEVRGINTKAQLAETEAGAAAAIAQGGAGGRRDHDRARDGVLVADTRFGRDVMIEPYVVFGPGVVIEDGAVIHSFSHLDGAHVGKARGRALRAAAARHAPARTDVQSAISSRSRRP